jgi:hypothetical protein
MKTKKPAAEQINQPDHYTSHPSGVECIEIAEGLNFNLGNAVKYVWRAGLKGDAVSCLRKSLWYLLRERRRLVRSSIPATSRTRSARQYAARVLEHVDRYAAPDALASVLCALFSPSEARAAITLPQIDRAAAIVESTLYRSLDERDEHAERIIPRPAKRRPARASRPAKRTAKGGRK